MGKITIVVALFGVVVAVWIYGAIHIVYGERLGIATCWKHGWSFSDTFVNDDEMRRFSRYGIYSTGDTPSEKLLDAVEKCQLIEDDGAWSRDKIIFVCLFVGSIVAIGGLIFYWGTKKQ